MVVEIVDRHRNSHSILKDSIYRQSDDLVCCMMATFLVFNVFSVFDSRDESDENTHETYYFN